jgi:hypothetical protein
MLTGLGSQIQYLHLFKIHHVWNVAPPPPSKKEFSTKLLPSANSIKQAILSIRFSGVLKHFQIIIHPKIRIYTEFVKVTGCFITRLTGRHDAGTVQSELVA